MVKPICVERTSMLNAWFPNWKTCSICRYLIFNILKEVKIVYKLLLAVVVHTDRTIFPLELRHYLLFPSLTPRDRQIDRHFLYVYLLPEKNDLWKPKAGHEPTSTCAKKSGFRCRNAFIQCILNLDYLSKLHGFGQKSFV